MPDMPPNNIDMKKSLFKLLLFFLPFFFIAAVTVIVDPYNIFNIFHVISDEKKFECVNRHDGVTPRGNILWKTIDFQRNPASDILIGNSRTFNISNEELSALFSEDMKNLSLHGGDIEASIELFWMAAKTTNLNLVIMQLDFNNYEAFSTLNLYKPVKDLLDKPSGFFFKWDYLTDVFSLLYYSITNDHKFVERSYMYNDDNWHLTYNYLENLHVTSYTYPDQLYNGLKEISEYCIRNNIRLYFVIAPNFREIDKYIERQELTAANERFKSDLSGLSPLIDLDTASPFTYNKDNFSDHFHLKREMTDSVAHMIHTGILNASPFVE